MTAGGTSTLTVFTTTAAVNGTYDIVGTGTSPQPAHSTTYSLTITGGSGNQCTATPWAASTVCTAGQRVSHEGHTWKAKWWTTAPPPHDPRNSAPYAPDHEHCTPRP